MSNSNRSGRGNSGKSPDTARLDRVVAEARRAREAREAGYREQALKIYPWVCGRCGRTFARENLRELTVHHKDMDHDNNPPDGSNWELLCLYCHDNEHRKYEEHMAAVAAGRDTGNGNAQLATHKPFGALADLIKKS